MRGAYLVTIDERMLQRIRSPGIPRGIARGCVHCASSRFCASSALSARSIPDVAWARRLALPLNQTMMPPRREATRMKSRLYAISWTISVEETSFALAPSPSSSPPLRSTPLLFFFFASLSSSFFSSYLGESGARASSTSGSVGAKTRGRQCWISRHKSPQPVKPASNAIVIRAHISLSFSISRNVPVSRRDKHRGINRLVFVISDRFAMATSLLLSHFPFSKLLRIPRLPRVQLISSPLDLDPQSTIKTVVRILDIDQRDSLLS